MGLFKNTNLKQIRVCGSRYNVFDLQNLDKKYKKMHDLHRKVHRNVIEGIKHEPGCDLLEIACGTGWNVPFFEKAGFGYSGLDISETAVAVSLLKYPKLNFANMSVMEMSRFRDSAFKIVYNSAMLEHIGFYKEALLEMIRVAADRLYVVFFEGLSDEDKSDIKFTPWEESSIPKDDFVATFGEKNTEQDHIYEEQKGWYWNRYCKKEILTIVAESGHKAEIMGKSTHSFFTGESVLVVSK